MFNDNIKVFVVGGAVRDVMLNKVPKDIDFVVVGATPADMIAKGFSQVGADFPVFLDKQGNEWALARTERKTSVGYKGFETEFDPSVTIEDDLRRRDLTINSMAVRVEDWESFQLTKCHSLLIDPFSGRDDLKWHVLRNTSEAFSEDPIRVLRTARFAARYNFNITQSTIQLMSEVVHELDHVPAERIWAEFEKGLMEDHAHKMIEVLFEVGAPNVERMKPFFQNQGTWQKTNRIESLKRASHIKHLPSRFALIGHGFHQHTLQSHRIPNDCADMSMIVNKFGEKLAFWHTFNVETRLNIIMDIRGLHRPISFIMYLFDVVDILFNVQHTQNRDQFWKDAKALVVIDAAEIAATCTSGSEIKEKLFQERLRVMSQQ